MLDSSIRESSASAEAVETIVVQTLKRYERSVGFGISGDGILLPMPAGQETFDGNFVAVPSERIAEIACRLQPTGLVS